MLQHHHRPSAARRAAGQFVAAALGLCSLGIAVAWLVAATGPLPAPR